MIYYLKKKIRLVLIAGPLNWCLSRLHTVDNHRVNMRLPYQQSVVWSVGRSIQRQKYMYLYMILVWHSLYSFGKIHDAHFRGVGRSRRLSFICAVNQRVCVLHCFSWRTERNGIELNVSFLLKRSSHTQHILSLVTMKREMLFLLPTNIYIHACISIYAYATHVSAYVAIKFTLKQPNLWQGQTFRCYCFCCCSTVFLLLYVCVFLLLLLLLHKCICSLSLYLNLF